MDELERLKIRFEEFKKIVEDDRRLHRETIEKLRRENASLKCYACGSMKCRQRERLLFCECGRVINNGQANEG